MDYIQVEGYLTPGSSRMSTIYESVNPNQQVEHTPPVRNRLSENDPVCFILDKVTELDISTITAKYQQEQQGFPPYSPRIMAALLLYIYFRGVFSSRQIMRACKERLTFRAIVGDNIPNWRIICDFRELHLKELEDLFVQVLKICRIAGLVKLRYIGPGSTKIRANAGQHEGISYCQMNKEEQQLRHEIRRLLDEAEAADKPEDQLYVTDCRSRELPDQLIHRQKRLELIWQDKSVLKTKTKNYFKRKAKIGDRSDERPIRERNRTATLDIPEESEIRPPTWEEAVLKCREVYREMISKHKNCPIRQQNRN